MLEFCKSKQPTNQALKPPLQLNKGTHERPCWCVKMGGMFDVLSQTQQCGESLECECANVNDCENHEPKLHEMKIPQEMAMEKAILEGSQG